MTTSDTSDVWKKLTIELNKKCEEQKVIFLELYDWILDSMQKIDKKNFDYYITSGPTRQDQSQKIDVSILLGRRMYSFTVSQLAEFPIKKTFSIFSLGSSMHYLEETTKESITCTFIFTELLSFFIMDSVANSDRLREFARKILESAWGR